MRIWLGRGCEAPCGLPGEARPGLPQAGRREQLFLRHIGFLGPAGGGEAARREDKAEAPGRAAATTIDEELREHN